MINIAILGFGVVGSGTCDVLSNNAEIIKKRIGDEIYVKKILDLRDFPDSPYKDRVTHDADEVFGDPDIKVAVETIGGARVAYDYTKRALSAGISVVTSNKELVSTHGVELMKLACDNGCVYLFEAAVGGGIPIIRPLYKCLAANNIVKIAGIVNGTTNYILSSMKNSGISYEGALKKAQQKGYAEQDPTADCEGIDAQRKISILSSIVMDGKYCDPSKIHAEGISKLTTEDIALARAIGCELKLIAYFGNNGDGTASAFVAPHFVDKACMLSDVEGVFNAVLVEGDYLGQAVFYGRGAGSYPTASAVAGDVIEACVNGSVDMKTRLWDDSVSVFRDYDDIKSDFVVYSEDDDMDLSAVLPSAQAVENASGVNAVIVNDITEAELKSKLEGKSGIEYKHYLK
ncbi:MAG: homoserine dehydrogenase [Saccharofermentans sp.]|nr:homoserine dehydrogenase [Saccharofermentans sp.]